MKLARRRRWWWLRVTVFVLCAACVMVIGAFLREMSPTLSLGRNLESLDTNHQIAVLALIDQMKTNPHMPDGEPLVINRIGFSRGMPDGICHDTDHLGQAMVEAAQSLGYEANQIRCRPDVGFFFQIEDPTGRIVAGYQCGSLCGSGNGYAVTRIGSTLILWRTSTVAM